MGQEIAAARFSQDDFASFARRLADETKHAREAFAAGEFAEGERVAGLELEAWLIDRNFYPVACNQAFLARMNDPLVVPELSRFNIELNGTPQPLRGRGLSRLEDELAATWNRCQRAAREEEATVIAIGTLPTLRESDLTLASMSPLKRYAALNRQVLEARGGRPLTLDIAGSEPLRTTHADVMLEAATTSFQVHLQIPASKAARYLNASMVLSAPLVALAANSPFVFGRSLWHETRIPLFEQAVDCGDSPHAEHRRVTFGSGYLGADPTYCFAENAAHYAVLLPLELDTPAHAYAHLRLHNGTIWRWNRMLIGFDRNGAPHLRIEQRVMPAGPSMIDMIANAAFYYGVVHRLASAATPPESTLAFASARENFYQAARDGLKSRIVWLDGRHGAISDLLEQELLPLAREGLSELDIAPDDIDRHLDVIAARLRTQHNGTAWQLEHYAKHRDFPRLTADYLEHQRSGMPVHEWPV
jgi:hypothetical protein